MPPDDTGGIFFCLTPAVGQLEVTTIVVVVNIYIYNYYYGSRHSQVTYGSPGIMEIGRGNGAPAMRTYSRSSEAKGHVNGLRQNVGDTEVVLYTPVRTVRAVGYNSFMPTYPHIEQYRIKLQELIEFGGSDNEENIRPAFQNCLDSYCRDHRERLVLIPELKTSPSNKPDGTVKDSLRMARGYWEAKDSHDDLDAEIQAKFNRGYPRDNIIFEDSQTAVLVQNASEAMAGKYVPRRGPASPHPDLLGL